MLRRMVLSDWRTTPWLENQTLFFELLDIKLIQLERRLYLKTYWTLPKAIGEPRSASLVPERSHVFACSLRVGS